LPDNLPGLVTLSRSEPDRRIEQTEHLVDATRRFIDTLRFDLVAKSESDGLRRRFRMQDLRENRVAQRLVQTVQQREARTAFPEQPRNLVGAFRHRLPGE